MAHQKETFFSLKANLMNDQITFSSPLYITEIVIEGWLSMIEQPKSECSFLFSFISILFIFVSVCPSLSHSFDHQKKEFLLLSHSLLWSA